MQLTPSVRKLAQYRFSMLAIPPGSGAAAPSLGAGVLGDPDKFGTLWREACQWTEHAISAVQGAPDNPYGDDPEAIAAGILEQFRQRQQREGG